MPVDIYEPNPLVESPKASYTIDDDTMRWLMNADRGARIGERRMAQRDLSRLIVARAAMWLADIEDEPVLESHLRTCISKLYMNPDDGEMIGEILAAHRAVVEYPRHHMVRGYDGAGHTGMDQIWSDKTDPSEASSLVVVEAKGATGALSKKPVYQELVGPSGSELGGAKLTQMKPDWMFVVANNYTKGAFTKAVFNKTPPAGLDEDQMFSLLICDRLWQGKAGLDGCPCVCNDVLKRDPKEIDLPAIRGLTVENGLTTHHEEVAPKRRRVLINCDGHGACAKQRPSHEPPEDLLRERSSSSSPTDAERKDATDTLHARLDGRVVETELELDEATAKLPPKFREFPPTAGLYLDRTVGTAAAGSFWETEAKSQSLEPGDRLRTREGKWEEITDIRALEDYAWQEVTTEAPDIWGNRRRYWVSMARNANGRHEVTVVRPAPQDVEKALIVAEAYRPRPKLPAPEPPVDDERKEPAPPPTAAPGGVDLQRKVSGDRELHRRASARSPSPAKRRPSLGRSRSRGRGGGATT